MTRFTDSPMEGIMQQLPRSRRDRPTPPPLPGLQAVWVWLRPALPSWRDPSAGYYWSLSCSMIP